MNRALMATRSFAHWLHTPEPLFVTPLGALCVAMLAPVFVLYS